MRIIGGSESGLRLATPKGSGVRPTVDRVREAIFNRLAADIVGAKILDLFSGTGAIGLESASRGAGSVLSVEKSPRHARIIDQNIRQCGYQRPRVALKLGCAFRSIEQLASLGKYFDFVFADPPFGDKTSGQRSQSMAQRLIDDPNLLAITHARSVVVLGHASRDEIEIPGTWHSLKQNRYGDATIVYLANKISKPTH